MFESRNHQGHSGKMLVLKKISYTYSRKNSKTNSPTQFQKFLIQNVSYLSKKKQFSKQKHFFIITADIWARDNGHSSPAVVGLGFATM